MRFNNRAFSEAEQLTRLVAIDGNTSGFIKDIEGLRIIDHSSTKVDLTGTLTETTLATCSVTAGAMGSTGFLVVWAIWSYTNNANTKIGRVRFGGTSLLSNTFTTTAAAPMLGLIMNRTVSTQFSGIVTGLINTTGNPISTSSINTANQQDLLFQGTLANVADTISLEGWLVGVKYKA